MKKIIFIFILLLGINRVKAIDNIEINNENLIPVFDKDIKVYNYYTLEDSVSINVINNNEKESNTYNIKNGKNVIIVDDYTINIFKNYNRNDKEEVYLTKLEIGNYDIAFNKDKYEYEVVINDEDKLDINYELSNDDGYVSIIGNGNFNKTHNTIIINVNNEYEYKINVYKTIEVSKVNNNISEFSNSKKEITAFILIVISCIIVFLFYYSLFINKTTLNI